MSSHSFNAQPIIPLDYYYEHKELMLPVLTKRMVSISYCKIYYRIFYMYLGCSKWVEVYTGVKKSQFSNMIVVISYTTHNREKIFKHGQIHPIYLFYPFWGLDSKKLNFSEFFRQLCIDIAFSRQILILSLRYQVMTILKTCTPRRPPNGTDDHLSHWENPSDPQYNFSAHQVSTTNVSKKSFNICPIEPYTRYGMELLF